MEEYMKKIILLVMAIAVGILLTACGAGDVGGPGYNPSSVESEQTESVASVPPIESYEDNLTGLTQAMTDRGYISGDPTTMSAQFIGAKEGYRYQFSYEKSKVTVELYEYDLENLNETAQRVISAVKQDGQFEIQGTNITATLSDNGKYLMIYSHDTDNEANQQRQTDVENLLKQFKS